MEPITAFVLSAGAATALALLVSVLLRRPLQPLLIELCGNLDRARFWGVFSVALSVLTALFCALIAAPTSRERAAAVEQSAAGVFDIFVSTSRAGVLGLLLTVGTLGFVLLISIGRFERARREERRRAVPA